MSLKADPPTKIMWLPLVNPHAEIRSLYERNLLPSEKDPMERACLADEAAEYCALAGCRVSEPSHRTGI